MARAIAIILLIGLQAAGAAEWRAIGPWLGSINDIAFDPGNPQTMYAGLSGAGVWRSDDGGQTWSRPTSDLAGASISWVKVDPSDSNTVYAGVGRGGGSGLWRSRDRGGSWSAVDVDPHSKALNQRLVFAPSDPDYLYVPSTNLHFRSTDGGETWSSFRVADQDAYTFAVHPEDPRLLLAGGRGSAKHFSRSRDGGDTWESP